MLKGVATTSSSEDQYGRVKVSCPFLWEEESTLLPVMNDIFISKGDEVILFSPENLQQSIYILGKFNSKANQDNNPIDTKSRPVLFKAHVGDSFIIATLDETLLHLETDKGLTLDLSSDSVKLEIPKVYSNKAKGVAIKATEDSFTITSKDGKELFTILYDLLDAMLTTSPTTLGSPSAQNFNPELITKLTRAQTDIKTFK